MNRLLEIIGLFKEFVLFALLIIVSLVLLGNNDNRQMHAIRAVTIGCVGIVQEQLSVIPNVIALRHENAVLRQLNVNLSDEVSRLREAQRENTRLREIIGLKEHPSYSYISADVIGKSVHLLRNTITLNIGEQDNVRPDMPIVSENGLVGKIIATSRHYAVGQLLLNKDFRASAKVERSRVDGIISWEGSDLLRLKNVSKKQDVKEGDVVLSSEYSNVFPRDIRIGTVTSVTEKPGNLFKDVLVTPSVDFSSLEQVFIIPAVQDTERIALERTALHLK
jgi:rod shape-determining protein MreC